MKISDHIYRSNRLLSSAEFLMNKQYLQEAVWIYGLAGTHLFNSALHLIGVTMCNQGLPTHNAGCYIDPSDLSKVFLSDNGDVIHANMPPPPPLTGIAEQMKQQLIDIEAIAIKALHEDFPVCTDEAETVSLLVLSLKEKALFLQNVCNPPGGC